MVEVEIKESFETSIYVCHCSASHTSIQRPRTHVCHVQPVRSFYQRCTSGNVYHPLMKVCWKNGKYV